LLRGEWKGGGLFVQVRVKCRLFVREGGFKVEVTELVAAKKKKGLLKIRGSGIS